MDYFACCVAGMLIISILACLFSGYAYHVNQRYAHDDPARRDYDLLAVFLAPITWPFLAFGGLVLTIIKAVLFGIFLLVFSIAVAVIRKPFFWPWIEPIVSMIGRRLLKANSFMIRLFHGD
jgi:hypothetical protein